MEKVDVVVIGGGAVGLGVASQLGGRQVVVLEKEHSFGRGTSSRNSEVIHGGMYYPPGSLKARLCVEGNSLVYQFCTRHSIPVAPLGKLIIAATDEEMEKVEKLFETGRKNGVPSLSLVSRSWLAEEEPAVRAMGALLSESTGIFDTHAYMKALEKSAEKQGVLFAYGCEVLGIEQRADGYTVMFRESDGSFRKIGAEILINCSGLSSDRIAAMAGIDTHSAGYTLHLCKGEYFKVSSLCGPVPKRLVYPVPTTTSLGIHTVPDLQGNMKLGPNAFYVNAIDYSVDSGHSGQFFDSVVTYLPALKREDLSPDMAGIRPKLQAPGEGFKDFIICEESSKGLPGFINLIGIESPGLTSSLAIGKYVESLLHNT